MKSINFKFRYLIRNFILSIIVISLGTFFISSLTLVKEIHNIKNEIYESFETIATIQGATFYSTHKNATTYYDSYNEYKNVINELSEHAQFLSVNYMLDYCIIQNVYGRTEQSNDAFYFNYELNYYPFDDGNNYYGVNLIGTNTSELIDELTNHITLTDGRYFTAQEIEKENVVIIPNNLVNENGNKIEIGDYISVQAKLSGPDLLKENLYNNGFIEPSIQLKVIGMYEVVDVIHDVPPYMYSTRIYTSNRIVEEYSNLMIKSIEQLLNVDDLMEIESEDYFPYFLPNTILPPYYKLNNYEEAIKFREKAEYLLSNTVYIKENYKVVTTNETIDRIIEPINSINKLASLVLIITLISLGGILFSFITLFAKKRTHEIAIYRALGMKKRIIIIRYCMEILFAVMIGFAGIKIFVPQVRDWMSNQIINYIKVEDNNQDNIDWDYFASGQYLLDPKQIENKNIAEEMNLSITYKEYLFCYGYILIITLLGYICIIVKVLKTKVKDILM